MEHALTQPLSQGEIEREIMRLVAELEVATDLYAEAVVREAECENAWKRLYHGKVLTLANTKIVDDDGKSHRPTVAWVEAQAGADYVDEVGAWRIAVAHTKALKEALFAKRTAIGALQTLSANIRAQT